jgi:class 3 adenylate cyclase
VTWTSAVLALVLLPLVAMAVRSLDIQRVGLEVAEKSSQYAVIELVWRQLEQLLLEARLATHQVGRVMTEGRLDDAARLDLGGDALARASVLRHVAFYSPEGKLLGHVRQKSRRQRGQPVPAEPAPAILGQEPEGDVLKEIPSALVAKAPPDGLWLPVTFGPAGPELRYLVLLMRGGERRAWLVGTLDPRRISEMVAAIGHDFLGGPERALVLDENLRVVAGLGRPVGSQVPQSHVLGKSGRFKPRDPFAPPDPAALASRDVGLAVEFTDEKGAPVMGTSRLVDAGFVISVHRPSEEILKEVARSKSEFLAAGLVVAALALLGGLLLAARVIRPVRSLAQLTQAYARRDFDARSPVKTGNELELLGDSLGNMASQLKASEAEIQRRAGVERDLSRYLPGEVARAVVEGRQGLQLGGEKRAITVLFADVVSFTRFAETAPPEQVVALLNELFTVLTEVVFRHGGTLDKFIGDCAMAVFGAPDSQPDHAERALAAAEDMHRFVESSAAAWNKKYGFGLALGIGVSSGEALVGNLGSERRMEYTAIGDVVNVAARLEAIARPGQTLLTAQVASLAGDAFSYRSLGEHPLHGKQQPALVMELA